MAAKIGDIGRATCPLYPSGRVVIDRAPMPARAEKGPIEEGTEIVVVGGDRFCLIVRPLDPLSTRSLLPEFGKEILSGKEDAAFQVRVSAENRRREFESLRVLFRKLMWIGAFAGLAVGIVLIAIQIFRAGYARELLWIPPLSSFCWFVLVYVACFLGLSTENTLVFISIPCATIALLVGMVWWGPFATVVMSFAIGIFATIASLFIEAMRHPIR